MYALLHHRAYCEHYQVNLKRDLPHIPAEMFQCRLGNRSALEWVVDQYRVKTDRRSGIENDPNPADDETYIVDLIRKVVSVSLETVRIVERLSGLDIGGKE